MAWREAEVSSTFKKDIIEKFGGSRLMIKGFLKMVVVSREDKE